MDYFEDADRQGREMQEAHRRGRESVVQERMQELGVSRKLEEYLLDLETKIEELKQSGG